MKDFERQYVQKIPTQGWMAVRLDGRGFSKFTKHMVKPFDSYFSRAMRECAKQVATDFNATCSYVQSDEATLLFAPRSEGERLFGGKVSKINSIFAATMTAHFNKFVWPENSLPVFDCRTWWVPDSEASNVLLWRYKDAKRNAVSAAVRWGLGLSTKSMFKLSYEDMQNLLVERGFNWNEQPIGARYGMFIRKMKYPIFSHGMVALRSKYELQEYSDYDKLSYEVRQEMCLEGQYPTT